MDISHLKRLKELEGENQKLKKMYADQALMLEAAKVGLVPHQLIDQVESELHLEADSLIYLAGTVAPVFTSTVMVVALTPCIELAYVFTSIYISSIPKILNC